MSEKIDNFTNNLRDKLNEIDDRLLSVKRTIESDLKIAAGTTKIRSWFLDAAIFMIGGERSPRIETTSEETQATIESKLNAVKAKLETKQHEFNAYRTKLKELASEKQAEVKSKVEEWKTKREIEKLNRRADWAENYAEAWNCRCNGSGQ